MYGTISLTNDVNIRAPQFDYAIEKLAGAVIEGKFRDLPELLKATTFEIGLKHIAYMKFSSEKSDNSALLSAVVTYSKEWQARYFLRRYQAIDPVVRHGVQSSELFDWSILRSGGPEVAAFFADAERYGVGRNGLTMPIRGRRNGFGLISLSSDLSSDAWELFKQDHLPKLKILALLIDSAASINSPLPANKIKLSRREEECLIWAARGKTYNETAEITNISYASVKTHLDIAKRKLKCVNIAHTVAVAVAIGLIPSQALKGSDPRSFLAE